MPKCVRKQNTLQLEIQGVEENLSVSHRCTKAERSHAFVSVVTVSEVSREVGKGGHKTGRWTGRNGSRW